MTDPSPARTPAGLRRRSPALWLCSLVLAGPVASAPAAVPGPSAVPQERLAAEDLEYLALDWRRGRSVRGDLEEVVEELPDAFGARSLLSRVLFEACAYEVAIEEGAAALRSALRAEGVQPPELAAVARVHAEQLLALGRTDEALAALEEAGAALRPDLDPRDAWALGSALLASGSRAEALRTFEAGGRARGPRTWDALLAQARCLRARGDIRAAASTLVAADKLARDGLGTEPDVLVALGEVYFEAYGEVNDALSRAHSPAELYREALRLHADHEGARLALFELYRFNWRRSRHAPQELLAEVLAARPDSIPGLLARTSSAIDDGNLPVARQALERLVVLAPDARAVRTEAATLAWIEHRREEALAIVEELVAVDPGDSTPERTLGRHLLELYRFAEGLPFLERAVERDPRDWRALTQLGRAQANTGDEEAARASLAAAEKLAEGRQDAWRDNTLLVLRRMQDTMVEHEGSELSFAWMPDAAPVLERYLVPFYTKAREELAQRYGFTPDPTRIEVFRRWEDFSVRSTGFEGFPALGVCFGPVVTALSPLSEWRGGFSWARTSFHEFTHVIHLGLSHNRCPRWVTEGLATLEEGVRNKAWWRNLRRELLDAHANGRIIPVRELNAAFRGPRVIFAYYQSGLLCKMLIRDHGFAPMVRLLEAFDRGADLDGALEQVFKTTPEELQRAFDAFVAEEVADLALEPRWSKEITFQRRFRLERLPPEEQARRPEWVDAWCKVAWGAYWAGELVDAKEALRVAATGGPLPGRGQFLRGELALRVGDFDGAAEAFQRGFEAGGEDFRARMAMASIQIRERELERAEEHLRKAEAAFPGYDDPVFNAELKLADLYEQQGRDAEANEARLRWLSWNADNYDVRVKVATWLDGLGRHEESVHIWQEAIEVDPFRRRSHLSWGRALRALGRHDEALREFEVGLLVTAALDLDALQEIDGGPPVPPGHPGALQHDPLVEPPAEGAGDGAPLVSGDLPDDWRALEPLLEGYRALTLLDLDRAEEARPALERALALDPSCAPALEARERLR